jgi:hypothetical protein
MHRKSYKKITHNKRFSKTFIRQNIMKDSAIVIHRTRTLVCSSDRMVWIRTLLINLNCAECLDKVCWLFWCNMQDFRIIPKFQQCHIFRISGMLEMPRETWHLLIEGGVRVRVRVRVRVKMRKDMVCDESYISLHFSYISVHLSRISSHYPSLTSPSIPDLRDMWHHFKVWVRVLLIVTRIALELF